MSWSHNADRSAYKLWSSDLQNDVLEMKNGSDTTYIDDEGEEKWIIRTQVQILKLDTNQQN